MAFWYRDIRKYCPINATTKHFRRIVVEASSIKAAEEAIERELNMLCLGDDYHISRKIGGDLEGFATREDAELDRLVHAVSD